MNIRNDVNFVCLIVTVVLHSGCRRNNDDDLSSSNLFSGFSGSSQAAFNETLTSYEGAPGWPARPRRTASFTNTINNESSLGVGIKFNAFGSEAESTLTAKFGFGYSSNLLLIRTSKNGEEGITKEEDENGNIYLNVEEGTDFVALCNYEAGVSTGLGWSNKVAFFGNGVGNDTDVGSAIDVAQSSFFFKVRETDSIQNLREKCQGDFKRRVKPYVVSDLERIVIASLFQQESNASEIEKGVAATLYGPRIKGVSLKGHKWSIYQADWVQEGTKMIIKQRLRRWRQNSVGVDRPYKIVIEEGQILSEEYPNGGIEAVKELARELAVEVFIEHSRPYEPVNPEPYMVNSELPEVRSNAYGQVSKGKSFSDASRITKDNKIVKVMFQGTDDRLLGMAYEYSNGSTVYRGWGDGSDIKEFVLDDEEYIEEIQLTLGQSPHLRIYSMLIRTTTQREFSMGIETMDRHFIQAPAGSHIQGFYGRTTDTIDQLGGLFGELFETNTDGPL